MLRAQTRKVINDLALEFFLVMVSEGMSQRFDHCDILDQPVLKWFFLD
jgi:hypothetical protein